MGKISWFKSMNAVMTTVCVGFFAVSSGYSNVHILDSNKATSNIRGNNFEFSSNDKVFSMRKNGELAGLAITDKQLVLTNKIRGLNFNGVVVVGAAAAGAMTWAAAGSTAAGAAVAAGATAVETAIPGGVAVAATLGGAGEVAAAAAAAEAGMTAGQLIGGTLAAVGATAGIAFLLA